MKEQTKQLRFDWNKTLIRILSLGIAIFAANSYSLAASCTGTFTYTYPTNTPSSLTAGQSLKIDSGTYTNPLWTFNSGATICVEVGATFSPSGFAATGTVDNWGTMGWPTSSWGGTINNHAGATWTMSTFQFGSGTMNNEGTLTVTGNLGTTGALNNAGNISISGTFTVGGPLNNTGKISTSGPVSFNGTSIRNYCSIVTSSGFTNNNSDTRNYGLLFDQVSSSASTPADLFTNNSAFYNSPTGQIVAGFMTNNGPVSGGGYWYFSGPGTGGGGNTINNNTFGQAAVPPGEPDGTANFYDSTPTGGNAFDQGNNSVSDTVAVRPPVTIPASTYLPSTCSTIIAPPAAQANLSVTKTNGTTAVSSGSNTTYTIVVSNAGPSAANGAILTDTPSSGLTLTSVSCTVTSGTAVCPVGLTPAGLISGVTISTFPANSSLTFTVVASVT